MSAFIKKLINRPCFTVSSDDKVLNIIEVLSQHNIGAVLVTNKNGVLEGIISERDIVRKLAHGGDISLLLASDIMTKEVVSVSTEASSSDLMQIMTQNKFRHLPIVSNGELLGIVSIGDVVKRLLEKYENEAEQMRSFINS